MYHLKLISLVFILFCGCKSEPSNTTSDELSTVREEIKNLTTTEKQKNYLEAIRTLDQKVRKDETLMLQKYGYDSKEHKESWEIINKTDDENLTKIESFLEIHGHPTMEKHGEYACGAPWIVIHHAQFNGTRRRNFEHLYNAWKNKDLDGGFFTFYLNRFYAKENGGKRLVMQNPYTEAAEVDTLIKLLNLKIP